MTGGCLSVTLQVERPIEFLLIFDTLIKDEFGREQDAGSVWLGGKVKKGMWGEKNENSCRDIYRILFA